LVNPQKALQEIATHRKVSDVSGKKN